MSYDSTVLADGPVAFWPLNETSGTTAFDATGNGHDGAYNGAVVLGGNGPCNDGETAPTFPGANTAYVLCASAAILGGQAAFTVEAWVTNLDTPPNFEAIYVERGPTGSDIITLRQGSAHKGEVLYDDDTGVLLDWTGTILTNTGDWVHYLWTRSGTTNILYCNGVQDFNTTGPAGNTWTNASITAKIGSDTVASNSWHGQIAKVAIYNYALTSIQAVAHFNARVSTLFSPARMPLGV